MAQNWWSFVKGYFNMPFKHGIIFCECEIPRVYRLPMAGIITTRPSKTPRLWRWLPSSAAMAWGNSGAVRWGSSDFPFWDRQKSWKSKDVLEEHFCAASKEYHQVFVYPRWYCKLPPNWRTLLRWFHDDRKSQQNVEIRRRRDLQRHHRQLWYPCPGFCDPEKSINPKFHNLPYKRSLCCFGLDEKVHLKFWTWTFYCSLPVKHLGWNQQIQPLWLSDKTSYLAQGRCCCVRIGTHDLRHRICLWIVEMVHFWEGFPRQNLRTNKFWTPKTCHFAVYHCFSPFPRVCVLIFLGGGVAQQPTKRVSRNDAPETTFEKCSRLMSRRSAYRLVIHGWLAMIGLLWVYPWLVSYDWLAMSLYDSSFLIGYLWLVIYWLSMIAATHLPCKQEH